ncbi:hypothetical protein HAX54_013886, partial [Datura stramonium]|nr:hypothetical protein [Datura stramonium]
FSLKHKINGGFLRKRFKRQWNKAINLWNKIFNFQFASTSLLAFLHIVLLVRSHERI